MLPYLKSFDNLTHSNVTEQPATILYINIALSRKICLILFSTLLVPSVLLALYIFYWIFRIPEIRNRLTNHLIIGIFVVSFIQVSFKQYLVYKIFKKRLNINGMKIYSSVKKMSFFYLDDM